MFKKALGIALLVMGYDLLVMSCFAQEEKLTITTYYPSPYGSYYELRAYKLAVGNPNDALFGGRFVTFADQMGLGEILAAKAFNISGRYYATRIAEKVISADYRSGTDIMSDLSVNILLDADANNSTTASFRILNATADSSDNSKELFRVNANGNVGIGTANPGTKLDIVGAGNSPLIRLTSDLATDVTAFLQSVDNLEVRFGTNSTHPLAIYTGGTERMRIDTSGNFGIGTTSPPAYNKLTVNGGWLQVTGAGATSWGDTATRIGVYDTDNTGGVTGWWFSQNNDGKFAIHQNAVMDRLIIDGSGNVGIGTTNPNPAAKLDVNGRVHLQSVSAAVPGEAGNLAWFNGGACSNIGELHVRDNGVNAVLCFCGRRGGGGILYCW